MDSGACGQNRVFCLRLHIHGPDRVCMLFCVGNNKRANARITNRCDFMSFPHIVALKADIGRHLHYLTCVENKTWAIRRLINRGRDKRAMYPRNRKACAVTLQFTWTIYCCILYLIASWAPSLSILAPSLPSWRLLGLLLAILGALLAKRWFPKPPLELFLRYSAPSWLQNKWHSLFTRGPALGKTVSFLSH